MARTTTHSTTKATDQIRAMNRLGIALKELEGISELFGNIALKAAGAAGKTAENVLRAFDEASVARAALNEDARYTRVQNQFSLLLKPPRVSPLSLTPDATLCGILPDDVRDGLVEAVSTFHTRFFLSELQWDLDGSIAASLQLVRSITVLSQMMEHVRKLIEIEYRGPVDLDDEHRGFFPAAYAEFLGARADYMKDLNRFRSRLLEEMSRRAAGE